MNVRFAFRKLEPGPNVVDFGRRCLQYGLGRFAHAIREVSVVVEDCNAGKGGVDKRCRAEVLLIGGGRVQARVLDVSSESAIHRATSRLRRRLQNAIGERNQNHNRAGLRTGLEELVR